MTDSITRCPKCNTSFRVNDEHLKTARGAVRCGSCLNIFNAKENLINHPANKTEAPEKASKSQPNDDEDILISDDMPLDDDDSDEATQSDPYGLGENLDENIFIAKSASKTEINLFERRIKDAEDHDQDHLDADESWAQKLLEESDDEPSAAPALKPGKSTAAPSSDINDSAQEEDTDTPTEESLEPESYTDSRTNNNSDDYNAAFQIIEDDPSEERGFEPFPDQLLSTEATDYEPELTAAADFTDPADNEYYNTNAAEDFESPHNSDFLESFEPEPLELHVKNDERFWHSRYFWASLNVLALLLVFIQIATFKFDDWAKHQGFRPYYAQACHITGCILPNLQDVSKIKIDNMLVINHPQKQGILLVDANLQNRAKFDQLFPTLMLTFTNLNNELISKFEFPPSTYVGGELAGKSLMPPKHPIHITLEIEDPGEDAVNYQISIVKPKN